MADVKFSSRAEGPRGERGARGHQGPAGAAGPPGDTGPAGQVAFGYRETAVNTTVIAATDGIIVVIGAAGSVTISLPAAATAPAGRRYTVKDGDGASAFQPITVLPAGVDTIDGRPSVVMNLAFGSLDFSSNGSAAWRLL